MSIKYGKPSVQKGSVLHHDTELTAQWSGAQCLEVTRIRRQGRALPPPSGDLGPVTSPWSPGGWRVSGRQRGGGN